jgi:hypothetical protein
LLQKVDTKFGFGREFTRMYEREFFPLAPELKSEKIKRGERPQGKRRMKKTRTEARNALRSLGTKSFLLMAINCITYLCAADEFFFYFPPAAGQRNFNNKSRGQRRFSSLPDDDERERERTRLRLLCTRRCQ